MLPVRLIPLIIAPEKATDLLGWRVGFCARRYLQAQKMCPQAHILVGWSHWKIPLAPANSLVILGIAKIQLAFGRLASFLHTVLIQVVDRPQEQEVENPSQK